jgi:class 3 adenylate cyclase
LHHLHIIHTIGATPIVRLQHLSLNPGVHAGDVIRENENIFGGAVNIAARIADAATAGEVVVSDVVRALGRTSAGVEFVDLGEHSMKGVTDPQRLWRVVVPEAP